MTSQNPPITIATWNCYQGTDRKVPALLDRFAPDIAVVPESSAHPAIAEPSLLDGAVRHHWTGRYEQKGLGVFLPGATTSTVVEADRAAGQHGLAVNAEMKSGQSCTVLGVWTVPLAGGGYPTPYANALSSILDTHHDDLSAGNMVVAGDFNCSGQSDPTTFPGYLKDLCASHDLKSAYHAHTGEAVGEESVHTLWWRSNPDAGFHCDFVLVPRSWTVHDVAVGSYEEWGHPALPVKSDHAPLIARVSPAAD
ncbi:MAG: endonuclease/exonuclease/phosphatase family protein [Actinomycetota bacterium]